MKKYFLLSALLFIASSRTATAQPQIGLELYSLRNEFQADVPGTLDLIEKWGIREIEGGGTYGLGMDEFKALLKERKLEMVSVGAEYAQLKDDPQAPIDNAKAFGAKYIVCFWIPHEDDEVFTIDHVKEAVKVFNTAGSAPKPGISWKPGEEKQIIGTNT
jgi:sugar phosphate isomerase/epimerase